MSYNPFENELFELEESDLETLIQNEIGEGWYIEYKREIPIKSSKLDNLKISKSIAAFANTKGGWIFWGIDCDNKNKPTEIKGIDISGYSNFEDTISQIINSNIDPNPYYTFRAIPLANGLIVFVIKVDASPIPPYITSQGIIYQRENNESKPVRDRYILQKLNEKAEDYYESIEKFTVFDLGQTKGQSESDCPFLELYLFPLPFDKNKIKDFYSAEFFVKVAQIFYKNFTPKFGDYQSDVTLNLGFNSIYSSEGSIIIRPLNESNLIYKSTTLELFSNGNLKLLIPINQFSTQSIPEKYKDSELINYLLDNTCYAPKA